MFGCCERTSKDSEEAGVPIVIEDAGESTTEEESHFLKTVGWVSAALGAVALGVIVGREIRQRYKFNRQTPYDLYSHSGDELPDVDCGVGI
jgi:DhnA family fructose-bisphosphate aldolase class Ia